ncbi:MAG TPA: hypothetical protein VES20_08860, partial [Bryobacteraceae bacterium]|nr:hypothetical protein [Bryobacteraceae bacterium]
ADRERVAAELLQLRREFPKIDMPEGMIRHINNPPKSPADCTFARTTTTISADLLTRITPCQFGGDPDCSQCGCIASMGLQAVASHKLGGVLKVGHIFNASFKFGGMFGSPQPVNNPEPAFRIINS